jgi:hypothetical protein
VLYSAAVQRVLRKFGGGLIVAYRVIKGKLEFIHEREILWRLVTVPK